MDRKRADRLKSMAREVAALKLEHDVPSCNLYPYVKFRDLLHRLCDGVRLLSGGAVKIEMAEMEKFYSGVEQAAARLLRCACEVIAADLDVPIADDSGDIDAVSFRLDWRTPTRWRPTSRVTGSDAPVVFVSPVAVVRAIVHAGGIRRPRRVIPHLVHHGWLRMRYRGRTELCTLPAFRAAVISRLEQIRNFDELEVVFDHVSSNRPELLDKLRLIYGREPTPQEVWRVIHQSESLRDQQEIFRPLLEYRQKPSIWASVTCRHDQLHRRARLEQTTGRLETQRAILAAYFAYLGDEGDVGTRLAQARARLNASIVLHRAACRPGATTPDLERYEQLRHWVDLHERWLKTFLKR